MVPMSNSLYEMQAEIFKSMGHPIRLQILKCLGEGELAVSQIVKAVGAEQSNVSRHLALLKQSGVLTNRKSGLRVFYRLSSTDLVAAMDGMLACAEGIMRSRLRAGASLLAQAPDRELRA